MVCWAREARSRSRTRTRGTPSAEPLTPQAVVGGGNEQVVGAACPGPPAGGGGPPPTDSNPRSMPLSARSDRSEWHHTIAQLPPGHQSRGTEARKALRSGGWVEVVPNPPPACGSASSGPPEPARRAPSPGGGAPPMMVARAAADGQGGEGDLVHLLPPPLQVQHPPDVEFLPPSS